MNGDEILQPWASQASPIARGATLALAAAALFGATAPFVQRASAGAGALACGCLLYAGAASASAASRFFRDHHDREAPLSRECTVPLVAMALLGGMLAPSLLVLGLGRIDAASASLLLALEAPWTLLLARLVHGEFLGGRVGAATACIFAGGIAIAGSPGRWTSGLGAVLVAGAALAWAADNIVSRVLADRDPVAVVAAKGALGAVVSAAASALLAESWPAPQAAAALLVVGALGYGLSLQLYLRAQRLMGAARTASIFASGPFLGAMTALLLGAPWPGWGFTAGGLVVLAGVVLHVTESHGHPHTHEVLEHEHAHVHDDGHHRHAHEATPPGAHSHRHRHEALTHTHEHGEDLHHRHEH
ncbi:MAG: EamA family transporter [Candidatus Wallbacteria bacterium]|nr:EamA family transporter [Candidatus Wallbacteria bacterium]